jgi:hypothetical protein
MKRKTTNYNCRLRDGSLDYAKIRQLLRTFPTADFLKKFFIAFSFVLFSKLADMRNLILDVSVAKRVEFLSDRNFLLRVSNRQVKVTPNDPSARA